MEITQEPYKRIQDCLVVQRGNVRHQNLALLNAILDASLLNNEERFWFGGIACQVL